MHYLTWKVLKQLHHSQPRKISSVTTGTCFLLFTLTEVNITYHGKKSDYPCIIFGMFLTPVYIEHSHGAIAGQSQYQLCILGINK